MRRTFALWLVLWSLACGCAAGLAAPAALASGSTGVTTQPSFNLNSAGSAAATQTTPAVASGTTTTSSSGGLSTLDGVIIAIVAALLLGGIAFLVWRDARGHLARAGHAGREDALFGQAAHAGSKAPKKPRKLTPAERKRRKRGRAR